MTTTAAHPAALAGVRVLDLTSGPAGGMATMVLADFGAEVLRIERGKSQPLDDLPAASLWLRGKRRLTLDLAEEGGRARFDRLAANADVLVCNWRPATVRRHGLDFTTLHARFPHLIVCQISGFGDRGPLADLPGYEHLVAARAGRMLLFSGVADRTGPVFSALQVGVHACAQSAAAGILAALHARTRDGLGRPVDTSILQGILTYEQGAMLAEQFRARFPEDLPTPPPPSDLPPLATLFYHPAQAGDGRWLQFGNLLPHLFDNFLRVTDLLDVLIEPTFDSAQMLLTDPERHEAFRLQMLARIQERTADEWMADFIADGGVVAGPYQTTQMALDDPDVVANGHVIPRADGGVELGPLARLTQTPAVTGQPAMPDDGLYERAWSDAPRKIDGLAAVGASPELPLAGLKVVEIATIIAAPMAAGCLADMGADVIKVEQIGGDPYRSLLAGMGAARVNAGKRSISLNLKAPAGREIVLQLLADADVLIHNYRPGVPERLGIGYEQVAAVNPRIIYLQANGYGPDGPGAFRPSTHPIPGAAMGGVVHQFGERLPDQVLPVEEVRTWTRRIMCANELNPDPNTSMVITTAVMLGIAARDRTGQGQRIVVDMFGANAYANSDDFLRFPGKRQRLQPDAGLHGFAPTYRLYRCADDQWVFLAAVTATEQTRLISVLADAGLALPDLTAEALGALFATRTADAWEALCVPAGVGCVRADALPPARFWLEHPQAQAMQLTQPSQHPTRGEYRRHGRLVTFGDLAAPLGPPPAAGEHAEGILAAAGYSSDDILALRESGVLFVAST